MIPSYRFTSDGAKLVYVVDGTIHVRSIAGDAAADVALAAAGAAFVDVPVRAGSEP